MTTLAKVSVEVETLRSTVRDAHRFIDQIQSGEDASDAYDRVKLAKEWAKIRKLSSEVAQELLALEIACLRKIAALKAQEFLPRPMRGLAEFWGEQTPEQVTDLIERFGADTVSAKTVKDRYFWDRANYTKAEYVSSGDQAANQLNFEADLRIPDHLPSSEYKAALAVLVQNFYDNADGEGFAVSDVAEHFAKRIGLTVHDDPDDWGLRTGTLELCRKAILEAPSIMIGNSRAPAFITCSDRGPDMKKGAWIRVPFRVANLWQLEDMVRLRRVQAEDAQRAAERMADLYDELLVAASEISKHPEQVPLGDVVAHVALRQQAAS